MFLSRAFSALLVLASAGFASKSFAMDCQYAKTSDGVIEVCPNLDGSGEIASFNISYSNGLLNKTRLVFVGALDVEGGRAVNLLQGQDVRLVQDGNYIGHATIPGGTNHLQIFFFTTGLQYDSNNGHNYSFDFGQ